MRRIESRLTTGLIAAALGVFAASALAEEVWDGFLCCNYRYKPDWMSDSNYTGYPIMPVGTPTRITDYGRYRVVTAMGGRKMWIGNDYSRNLSNVEFAKRIVVKSDPTLKIKKFPARIQQAIAAARVGRGMTREQVLMAIGYPIFDETPVLEAPVWRYWLSSFEEFQVNWSKGVVSSVTGASGVVSRVYTADSGAASQWFGDASHASDTTAAMVAQGHR